MRKLFAAAVAFALLGLAAQQASADDQKSVVIGTEGAYPPFNYIDENGELQGFDVDIAKALCEAANFKCTFVKQAWDGIIPGLLAKKYDAIVASMSITDERKKVVDFTDKYYNTPAKFVAADDFDVDIPDDTAAADKALAGKVIGVQTATIHENFARDNFPDATIKAYGTQDEANLDLVNGRVDLVLADSVALNEGFLKTPQGAGFKFVGPDYTDPKWFGDGAGIAVRKEDTWLKDALNKALAQILADGTYKKINDKYFDFDVYGQ
jgi:lysine-arginine-ornithine-binding protein